MYQSNLDHENVYIIVPNKTIKLGYTIKRSKIALPPSISGSSAAMFTIIAQMVNIIKLIPNSKRRILPLNENGWLNIPNSWGLRLYYLYLSYFLSADGRQNPT